MTLPFKQAADGSFSVPASQLTFVCDTEGTLSLRGLRTNDPLLEFLSDASKDGHRVIITSKRFIGNSVQQILELTALKNPNIDPSCFEYCEKGGLTDLLGEDGADYVFDDDPVTYVAYGIHVRTNPDTGGLSMPLSTLRSLSGVAESVEVSGAAETDPAAVTTQSPR